jgi:hypothetical protein
MGYLGDLQHLVFNHLIHRLTSFTDSPCANHKVLDSNYIQWIIGIKSVSILGNISYYKFRLRKYAVGAKETVSANPLQRFHRNSNWGNVPGIHSSATPGGIHPLHFEVRSNSSGPMETFVAHTT